MLPNTVLAKPRGHPAIKGGGENPTETEAYYDVPIIPKIPIKKGQHIQLYTLQECPRIGEEQEQEQKHDTPRGRRYLARKAKVEGTVTNIERSGRGAMVEIRNELPLASVARAVLVVKDIEGVTVEQGKWKRWWEKLWNTRGAKESMTKTVPLELDATIVDKEEGRGAVTIPLCLACGMPSTSDADREWAERATGW